MKRVVTTFSLPPFENVSAEMLVMSQHRLMPHKGIQHMNNRLGALF